MKKDDQSASLWDVAQVPGWLVRLLIPQQRREEIVGDLCEWAETERRCYGRRRARRAVWYELLRSAPSFFRLRLTLRRSVALVAPASLSADSLPAPEVIRAFAALLEPPRRRRVGWSWALTIGCHGALLSASLLWESWQIEELSPVAVPLVLVQPAGAPYLAAAEAKGGAAAAKTDSGPGPSKRATRPRKRPSRLPLTAAAAPSPPADTAESPPDPSGFGAPDGGGTGPGRGLGTGNGDCAGPSCAGSDDGGGGGASVIGPRIAGMQCTDCPPPGLPAAFANTIGSRALTAKICVSQHGAVSAVTVLRGIDEAVDSLILDKVKRWRYRPYRVNDRPVSFCYVSRFVFQVH